MESCELLMATKMCMCLVRRCGNIIISFIPMNAVHKNKKNDAWDSGTPNKFGHIASMMMILELRLTAKETEGKKNWSKEKRVFIYSVSLFFYCLRI